MVNAWGNLGGCGRCARGGDDDGDTRLAGEEDEMGEREEMRKGDLEKKRWKEMRGR